MLRTLPCIVAALFLTLVAANTRAEDTDEARYIAVATARAKTELAVRKLQPLLDDNSSGWRIGTSAMELAVNRCNDLLNTTRDAEGRKPEDDRNAALMEDCAARETTISRDWQAFAQVLAKLESQHRSNVTAMSHLIAAMENVSAMDAHWKEGGLDLESLEKTYDAIAKHAAELLAAEQKVISLLQQHQKTWEGGLEELQRLYPKK